MEVIRLTLSPHKSENSFDADSEYFAGAPKQANDGLTSKKTVLAIGEFDGMHRGHREVIERAKRTAALSGAELAIMTFDPHPRKVLGHDKYERLLTPTPRKLELFEELGVGRAYVTTFNESLMRMNPDEFVETVLIPLNLESIVVGFDFRFGHKASGNVDLLCGLAGGRFAVEVVRAFEQQGFKISSTAIRDALASGDVWSANELLSRRYDLRGSVVHGDARGRTIGFPTANLELTDPYVVPGGGVYAICARLGDERYGGVMNIGFKPTFNAGELKQSLEAHLFEFSRDIYGDMLQIEFVERLRDEQKFPSIDALVAQILKDSTKAREKVKHLLD